MSAFINLSGKKFGRLLIKERCWITGKKDTFFKAVCDCGNPKERVVRSGHILSGAVRSCGCLVKEEISKRSLRHGHAKREGFSPEYICYRGLKARCYNPNNKG